jgi:hypothetical protein
MLTVNDSGSFKLPDAHKTEANEGKAKYDYSFESCESDKEAIEVINSRVAADKEAGNETTWTVTALVNARLCANAKQNAYVKARAKYFTTKKPEDARRAAILNLIQSGVPEEVATKLVMDTVKQAA